MTSRFEGYIKVFVRLALDDPCFTEYTKACQDTLLRQKLPFHESHVTLLVINVKKDTLFHRYLLSDELLDVVGEVHCDRVHQSKRLPLPLEWKDLRYALTDEPVPSLVLDMNACEDFPEFLWGHRMCILDELCARMSLEAVQTMLNGYSYVVYRTGSGDAIFNTSMTSFSHWQSSIHQSICSLSDIKNHNKALAKKLKKAKDQLGALCDPLQPLSTAAQERAPIDVTQSRVGISYKEADNYVVRWQV
jgi:hypothetical protein